MSSCMKKAHVDLLRDLNENDALYFRRYIVKDHSSDSYSSFQISCDISSDCFNASHAFDKQLKPWVRTARANAREFRGHKATDFKKSPGEIFEDSEFNSVEEVIGYGVSSLFAEILEGSLEQCERRIRNHVTAVLLHAKFLVSDATKTFKDLYEPVFYDVIYLGKEEFEERAYEFVKMSLKMSLTLRKYDIAKNMMRKSLELAVVSLFFSRYLLLIDCSTNLDCRLPPPIEKNIVAIKSEPLEALAKTLKVTFEAFQAHGMRQLYNQFTKMEDLIVFVMAPVEVGEILMFLKGLLKQYEMLENEKKKVVSAERIRQLEDSIFCNPVYRQILVVVENAIRRKLWRMRSGGN